ADAAVGLIRDVFTEGPTVSLADALQDHLAGDPDQLITLLMAAAPKVQGAPAVEILLRAARTAAEQDAEQAYDIYRQVVERDATRPEPRTFCLRFAADHQDWKTAVAYLQLNAKVEPDLAHDH